MVRRPPLLVRRPLLKSAQRQHAILQRFNLDRKADLTRRRYNKANRQAKESKIRQACRKGRAYAVCCCGFSGVLPVCFGRGLADGQPPFAVRACRAGGIPVRQRAVVVGGGFPGAGAGAGAAGAAVAHSFRAGQSGGGRGPGAAHSGSAAALNGGGSCYKEKETGQTGNGTAWRAPCRFVCLKKKRQPLR